MKPVQCRMARAALEWSTQELGRRAGVGVNTVNRFETGQDARLSSVDKMRGALETGGVIFVEENGEGPGVRLRKGANVSAMQYKVEASHGGHVQGIRDRMAAEDATTTPDEGMDALQRGRPENKRRKAAKSGAAAREAKTIASGHEARGRAEDAVDEAQAGSSGTAAEKASRKRKLTKIPKGLKPR